MPSFDGGNSEYRADSESGDDWSIGFAIVNSFSLTKSLNNPTGLISQAIAILVAFDQIDSFPAENSCLFVS